MMRLGSKVKSKPINQICFILFLIVYGASLVYLFYHQMQWTDGAVYESDLPFHISMVLEDGWYYSLTAFIYKVLYQFPSGAIAVSLFLASVSVLTVWMTRELLIEIGKLWKIQIRELHYNVAAVILNFVMPCYIRGAAEGRYIGMQSPSIWHNSTYICMKCLALGVLLVFLPLRKNYWEPTVLSVRKWLMFMGLLLLTTAIKPNFLLIFAPVMAFMLLYDLIKGKPFWKIFWFGSAVLPSVLIIYLQEKVLFGGDTGNGITFQLGYTLTLHSGHPLAATILSAAFPGMILCYDIVHYLLTKKWNWMESFIIAMLGVGYLELACFSETGTRASDGNFLWGYSFSLFLAFIVCLIRYYQILTSELENGVTGLRIMGKRVYLVVVGMILCWHVGCGLLFYVRLVGGTSYWMWT